MLSNYPGYQRFFSRAAGIFGVLAEGRHIFDRRPKPRAAKPGHYTETWQKPETAIEKSLAPRVLSNRNIGQICVNIYFFVLFFCLLLHRLPVRISLPFYDCLQVIIVLILACVASVSVRFAPPPPPLPETKKEERESKTARKTAQVKGLLFHFSRGQNREFCSSVFLYSEETKRKRLLRRLYWSRSTTEDTVAVNGLSLFA